MRRTIPGGVKVAACWVLIVVGLASVSLQFVGPKGDGCLPNPNLHLASSARDALAALKYTEPPCVWGAPEEAVTSGARMPRTMPAEDRLATLVEQNQHLIDVSWYFTVGAFLFFVGALGWGALRLYGTSRRDACRLGMFAAGALFLVDCVENITLRAGLDTLEVTPNPVALRLQAGEDVLFQIASVSSVIVYALLLPLTIMAVVVLSTLLSRAVLRPSRIRVAPDEEAADAGPDLITSARWPETTEAAVVPKGGSSVDRPAAPVVTAVRRLGTEPPGADDEDQQHWRDSAPCLPGRERAEVGICASGGGIRSATVTLGALQQLRTLVAPGSEESVLRRARYLVSVSGGGYMAGAFQLALQPDGGGAPDDDAAATVLAPGSVEEDHVRRHANYLADSLGEWIVALAVLLRGVIASLGLLTLVTVLGAMITNFFYRAIPVVCLDGLRPGFDPPHPDAIPRSLACVSVDVSGQAPPAPDLMDPALWALLGMVGLAALAWLVSLGLADFVDGDLSSTGPQTMHRFSVGLALLLAVTAAYVLVLPMLMWLMSWLTYAVPGAPEQIQPGVVASVVTFVTWLGALAATLWRTVRKVKPSGESAPTFSRGVRKLDAAVGTSLTQRLIVAVVLLVIAVTYLQLFSWVATTAQDWGDAFWPVLLFLGGLLVLLSLLVDQTRLSLHFFYRRRLATAFAVRRKRAADGVKAVPYAWDEPTPLTAYADRAPGFPQVVFAASAAVSGSELAPPGRRAVSFTFASDYVGGPDVGWVRTSTLERSVSQALRRDVTVQSAVAVSGAAIASSMGRMASPTQRLLALSNVRLGTWLPNPGYLALVANATPPAARWLPRVPHVRRLKYHLREVVGSFGGEGRMLLCTDGGHYDNLGLVEMLRLGSRLVFVIDGTGDAPPFANALGDAIALAREELGVVVSFDEDELISLVPGSAEAELPEGLEQLAIRMSKRCVAIGSIRYPQPMTLPDGSSFQLGTVVLAKATLTPEMPYDLLTYSLTEPTFPRQSTADQWFNHRQFDAYHTLGSFLAGEAVRRYRDHVAPSFPLDQGRAAGDGAAAR